MSKNYRYNSSSSSSGGMGLLGVLQVIFIVLKVLNMISWSWWAVFIPTFISIGLLVIGVIVILLIEAKDNI